MKHNESRPGTQTRTSTPRRLATVLATLLAGAGVIAFVARLRR
ncbi:MAG TPA: hypothetical protein VGJ13_21630 [Pseudonocardiaceae bacterium]|jgi:hypothetical protein